MQYERLIGYRPHLEYTDEYTSDAADIFNSQQEDSNIDTDNSIIDNLIEQMEIIDSLIDKLPGGASDTIGEVFDQVIDFIEDELKDEIYDRVPEEIEWTITVDPGTPPEEDEGDDSDKEVDEENFWDPIDPFPIIKEEHTKEEVIQKEYIKNLTDLFDDYFVNMHNTLSNFWTNLVTAVLNKEADEIEMLVNNILLSSSDIKLQSKHLLDSAIKNQITRTMKLDYFSTIFNAEQTIGHLKQFKAIYELRLRYANIEKIDGNTKSNQMNNNILEGMRIVYDKKYDIAYENLFRYLKSSIDVLDDTLKTWLIEIKSKQTLIERKGIK